MKIKKISMKIIKISKKLIKISPDYLMRNNVSIIQSIKYINLFTSILDPPKINKKSSIFFEEINTLLLDFVN